MEVDQDQPAQPVSLGEQYWQLVKNIQPEVHGNFTGRGMVGGTLPGNGHHFGPDEAEQSELFETLPQPVKVHYFSVATVLPDLDLYDMHTLFNASASERFVISPPVLGRGAYGCVYRAVNHTDSNCAIKVLKPSPRYRFNSDSVHQERVIVYRLLSHESHLNVLQYLAGVQSPNAWRTYFVSELATRGDLQHFVEVPGHSGWAPMRDPVCRYLIKHILNGLHHLESLGISHNDIKLENILLFDTTDTSEPIGQEYNDKERILVRTVPKLADFNHASLYTPPHRPRVRGLTCSEQYAAPEAYYTKELGQDYDQITANIYSVGVCLLALLVGYSPFKRYPTELQEPAPGGDWRAYMKELFDRKLVYKTLDELCKIASSKPEVRDAVRSMIEPNPAIRINIGKLAADPWLTEVPLHVEGMDQDWIFG